MGLALMRRTGDAVWVDGCPSIESYSFFPGWHVVQFVGSSIFSVEYLLRDIPARPCACCPTSGLSLQNNFESIAPKLSNQYCSYPSDKVVWAARRRPHSICHGLGWRPFTPFSGRP